MPSIPRQLPPPESAGPPSPVPPRYSAAPGQTRAWRAGSSLDRAVHPVRKFATDPNSGTTLGSSDLARTDENHSIDRIILRHLHIYFGYGMHVRLYEYPSETNSGRW